MLKFLRKYQLLLLAVGGSLLMVVFLLEPVLTRIRPNPANATAATLGPDGDIEITRGDREMAYRETRVLASFAPLLVSPQSLALENDRDHWLLLSRFAEEHGFVGENEDGITWLPDLAREQAALAVSMQIRQQFGNNASLVNTVLRLPQTQQQVNELAEQLFQQFQTRRVEVAQSQGFTLDQFDRTLARARGVSRMMQSYQTAPRLSAPEAKLAAAETADSAVADLVLITAADINDLVVEPTEGEIIAHFEKYKDERPAENELGFGYLLPPRAKLSWLKVDRDAIRASITLDRVEVNKRYRQSHDRFPGEFSEERPRVEAIMRNELVEQLVLEADRAVRAAVLSAIRPLPEDGEYRVVTDLDQVPTLETIAQQVVATVESNTGHTIPLPEVRVETSSWNTRDGLAALDDIGTTEFRAGSARIPFPDVLDHVRELNPSDRIVVQQHIPVINPPLEDAFGNRYYVVIEDVRPESPPDSLEEIREQLVVETRAASAYTLLTERLDQFADTAREGTLADVVTSLLGEPRADRVADPLAPGRPEVAENIRVFRRTMQSLVGGVFDRAADAQPARDAIVDAAEPIDPRVLLPEAERPVIVAEVPSARGVVVAKIRSHRPITVEAYRAAGEPAARQAIITELQAQDDFFNRYPFRYAALQDRYNYTLTSAAEDDEG